MRKENSVYSMYSKEHTVFEKQCSKKAKLLIFTSVYWQTIIYEAECWTILDKHTDRIKSAVMRFLQWIMGKTWRDHISNIFLLPFVNNIQRIVFLCVSSVMFNSFPGCSWFSWSNAGVYVFILSFSQFIIFFFYRYFDFSLHSYILFLSSVPLIINIFWYALFVLCTSPSTLSVHQYG